MPNELAGFVEADENSVELLHQRMEEVTNLLGARTFLKKKRLVEELKIASAKFN